MKEFYPLAEWIKEHLALSIAIILWFDWLIIKLLDSLIPIHIP